MELFAQILAQQLACQITITPEVAEHILQMPCYQALKEIRQVLDDDTLEDSECFDRIEQIVCIFEKLGSDGGNRHDF